MRDLELPRGDEREIVHDARDREYASRGSESRTLSTAGAFRVGSSCDLRNHHEHPVDPSAGDLCHPRYRHGSMSEAESLGIPLYWQPSAARGHCLASL